MIYLTNSSFQLKTNMSTSKFPRPSPSALALQKRLPKITPSPILPPQQDRYTALPKPILLDIASNLSLKDLAEQSQTSKIMSQICSDRQLWYSKLKQDYPDARCPNKEFSWIDAYLDKLRHELTEDTAEKLYRNKYGDDIDFMKKYFTCIGEKLRYAITWMPDIGRMIRKEKFYKALGYASSFVDLFIRDPNSIVLFKQPSYSGSRQRAKELFTFLIDKYDPQTVDIYLPIQPNETQKYPNPKMYCRIPSRPVEREELIDIYREIYEEDYD